MKTNKTAQALTLALLIIGSLVGGANAQLTLYTSRSAWETRLSQISYTTTTEDFSSVASDITLDPGNLVDDSTGTVRLQYDPYMSATLTSDVLISSSAENVELDPNTGLALVALDQFALPTSVSAFGFDYDISAAPGEWTASINAPGASAFLGDGDASDSLPMGPASGFVGWIDETSSSIQNISIVNAVTGGSSAEIDNVSYGVVPEPSSAMLILLGFAGLALRRVRSR